MMTSKLKKTSEDEPKRKFDKKKWREIKYSKAARVKQWEEKRRKVMKHKLNKQLRKEGFTQKDLSQSSNQEKGRFKENHKQKVTLQQTLAEKKKQREQEEQDRLKRKKEQQEALQQYKIKKLERVKKLSRKTRKGQPLMNPRIELLYKQLQSSIST
ncbi:rRNA-processing protein FYV7-like [Cimex lectularius]|uniref:Thyroid transcription factor 1-associated protein 26 n=1 Tax=Cimex lectularius TaxID=79782 RepID=A0A8I6RLI8_CIMLE|nr:rRNA-processing protein FYV7-like [Cimex lectularius]